MRCVRLLVPLQFTAMFKSLNSQSEIEKQNEVFHAMSRLAFEKDPESQINLVLLDYHTLDSLSGQISL